MLKCILNFASSIALQEKKARLIPSHWSLYTLIIHWKINLWIRSSSQGKLGNGLEDHTFFWSSAGVGGLENEAVPLGRPWPSTRWTHRTWLSSTRLWMQPDHRFPQGEIQRKKWSCPALYATQIFFNSVRDTWWLLRTKLLFPLKLLLQCRCPRAYGCALTEQYVPSFKKQSKS